jgi:hypothetical protein
LQEPAPQHADPVAHRHRLDLVVRDVDRRHAEVALDAGDLGAHLDAELGVEIRERLVHQERLWLADDRAAHRDALSLAARERARLLLQDLGEAERPRRPSHAALDLRLLDPAHLQRERHVVVGRHMGIERIVLEDHRDVPVLGWQRVHNRAADPDRPRGDHLQPGDHPQRRRLAAAGRADEDHELPVGDREVEVGDRLGAVRVDLRQLVELDLGHAPLLRNLLETSYCVGSLVTRRIAPWLR